MKCYHGVLFSPVYSTLLKAIKKGHFMDFPGFTENLITKHLLPDIATTKRHHNQERQQLQTTKIKDWKETAQHIRTQFQKLKNQLPAGTSFKEVLTKDIIKEKTQ